MLNDTTSRRAFTGLGLAIAALPLSTAAQAQITEPLGADEVAALPPEYRTGPVVEQVTETITDENGVETITRTRRIETTTAYPAPSAPGYAPYPQAGYAPAYAPRPGGV